MQYIKNIITNAELVDYLYIIVLMIFVVFLCFIIVIAILRGRKYYTNRPDSRYIMGRIIVNKIFSRKFETIKNCARRLTMPNHRTTMEINDLKDSLNQYINDLSKEIRSLASEKNIPTEMIHKAVHFEIKKNCMLHPLDIIGSLVSKKIEKVYKEVNACENRSYIFKKWSSWNHRMSSFVSRTQNKVSKTKDEHQSKISFKLYDLKTLLAFSIPVIIIMVVYKCWLEAGVIIFLVLFDLAVLRYINAKKLLAKYKYECIIRSVSMTIFLSFGLYLYDNATDIDVLLVYSKSCYDAYKHQTFSLDGKSYNITSINDYLRILTSSSNDTMASNGSKQNLPIFTLALVLIISTPLSLFSLPSLITNVRANLWFEGEKALVTSKDHSSGNSKEDQKVIPMECVMTRNELSIEEAGVESVYQFIIQWSIYYSLTFWLSLSREATESLIQSGALLVNDSTSSADDIVELPGLITKMEQIFVFNTLWKSGLTGLLALSSAQFKINAIQHQLSLNLTQKICYLVACILNTLSYLSLSVVITTHILDVLILKDLYGDIGNFVEFIIIIVMMMVWGYFVPSLIKFIEHFINRMLKNNESLSPNTGKILANDLFWMKILLQPMYFYLPTSQTPEFQRIGKIRHMTYNHKNSSNLKSAFIHQCFQFIIWCTLASVLGIIYLVLLFEDETIMKLPSVNGISPSKISRARKKLLIFSSISIPLGWLLSYFFLYLYFSNDNGYFAIAAAEFEYKDDCVLSDSNAKCYKNYLCIGRKEILTHNSCWPKSCNCNHAEDINKTSRKNNSNEVVNIHVEKSQNEHSIGDWIDLYITDRIEDINSERNRIEVEEENQLENLLCLDQEEQRLFLAEIRNSFPYFRVI